MSPIYGAGRGDATTCSTCGMKCADEAELSIHFEDCREEATSDD